MHDAVDPDPAVRTGMAGALARRLADAAGLGASIVRVDLWWSVVEPAPGVWSWETTDRVVAEITAAGLTPYAILCYGPAWNAARAPVTAADRAAFGAYVRAVVTRYRGQIRYWEIWNEPDITPFWAPQPEAADYAALLAVAWREAKAADPGCTVVGLCTSQADADFIEGVFQHGAADHLDALSFHHYSAARDEAAFLADIRTVRGIATRHGRPQLPLFITEMGIPDGPNTIMPAFGPREQAAWIVKRHLLALAADVAQCHYFCLRDWGAVDPPGDWGLLKADATPKPAATAYRTLTGRLHDAAFCGAVPLASDNGAPADTCLLVFARDNRLDACGWVRRDGPPVTVELPATGPVQRLDLLGEEMPPLLPDANHHVRVELTREPCYLLGLDPTAVELAPARLEPATLFVAPGEKRAFQIVADNPSPQQRTIDLTELREWARRNHFDLALRGCRWTVAPRGTACVRGTLTLPAHATPFVVRQFQAADATAGCIEFTVARDEAFDVRMHAESAADGLQVHNRIFNRLGRTVSAAVETTADGGEAPIQRSCLRRLAAHSAVILDCSLPARLGAQCLTTEIRTRNGPRGSGRLQLWGQPFAARPVEIDGLLADWADVPAAHLAPPGNQVEPDRDQPLAADEFHADVRVQWTATDLLIAVDVEDATPLVNPHPGPELWRGDGVELYLAFDGPTTQALRPPGSVQLCIAADAPGDAIVWNFNARSAPAGGAAVAGAAGAARRRDGGYTLEARIPLAAIGGQAVAGKLLGFDVAINNLIDAAAQKSAVLMWSGNARNWRDASRWGVAWIQSDGG